MSVASQSLEGHVPSHHPDLRHHFDDLEQQHDAYTLCMWAFIVQEVMFFSGMIVAYFVYRYMFPVAFIEGSNHLDIGLSTLNTVILLISSFTMALAVRSAQVGQKMGLILFMVLTLVFGSGFLGVKAYEYYEKYEHNLIPGYNFEWPAHGETHAEATSHDGHDTQSASDEAYGEAASHGEGEAHEAYHGQRQTAAPINYADMGTQVSIFYGLYFIMTGFHALHMVIGGGVILILIGMAWYNKFSPNYYAPIEMFGLYWHFVDVVWVFLFPLLYLVDRAESNITMMQAFTHSMEALLATISGGH